MTTVDAERAGMLRVPFLHRADKSELVGVEIEAGVVDPDTGVSRRYDGPRGVAELLRLIARRWRGEPVVDNGALLGVKRHDGVEIALESGCALEYASVPVASLVGLVDRVNADTSELAGMADELGLALLSGSMLPFDTPDDVCWAPKPRIPLMLDYFRREVGSGSEGWAAMSQILSIQTTLDYLDERDLIGKHRVANAVSVLVAALFVNSPARAGKDTGFLSERMRIWQEVDDRRVGYFDHSLDEELEIDDLIDSITALPPIFRVEGGRPGLVPPWRSFRELFDHGYGDSTFPSEVDWRSMLATTWPYVRLRETLELRIADGPHHLDWAAAPALWVGLIYDPTSRAEAWDLMRGHGVADHIAAVDDVAANGLNASVGGVGVRGLCADLVRIARDGLARRVASGAEPDKVLSYLDPVDVMLASGVTAAERLAARWDELYADDPGLYVEEYRYP